MSLVRCGSWSLLVLMLSGAAVTVAAEEGAKRKGEIGLIGGALLPDTSLTAAEDVFDDLGDYSLGLRGGFQISRRWRWFADLLHSEFDAPRSDFAAPASELLLDLDRPDQIEAVLGLFPRCGMPANTIAPGDQIRLPLAEDADALTLRTGVELSISKTWYLSLAGGWISGKRDERVIEASFGEVDCPGEPEPSLFGLNELGGDPPVPLIESADFDEALASFGIGQRFETESRVRYSWEARVDHVFGGPVVLASGMDPAMDFPPLFDDTEITQVHVLFGVSWGVGRPPAIVEPSPAVPMGEQVVELAPVDSDGDGIADEGDACPGTPAGWSVGSDGCPVDSDGDSVPDARDGCTDTPRGWPVDDRGCPKDSDADGVPDGRDKCPGTAAGSRVDDNGCRIVPKPLFGPDQEVLLLVDVHFAVDSDVLRPNVKTSLDGVATLLLDWPEVRVEVAGHTDSTATEEYNLDLSQRRAEKVRGYLVSRGVPAGQLEARGYGETQPVAANDSEAGRANNRRVELRRLRGSTSR